MNPSPDDVLQREWEGFLWWERGPWDLHAIGGHFLLVTNHGKTTMM